MSKRMFAPEIVTSDAFLDMPQSAQNLYFHFGMRADDDGFLNPRSVIRMVGATNEDLEKLKTERFVLSFESGIIVIKHWRLNNYIRKDRYKPTNYTEEKKLLFVKENGSYTFDQNQGQPIAKVIWKSDDEKRREKAPKRKPATIGIPTGIPVVDAGKVRLGKVSIEQGGDVGTSPTEEKQTPPKEPELPLPGTVNAVAWDMWLKYRRERKLPTYKNSSKTLQWDMLSKWSKDEQLEIIKQSIANSWQGLFPLKKTNVPQQGGITKI